MGVNCLDQSMTRMTLLQEENERHGDMVFKAIDSIFSIITDFRLPSINNSYDEMSGLVIMLTSLT